MWKQHRKRSTGHTPQPAKILLPLFYQRGTDHHRLQVPASHIQLRFCNTITETAAHLNEDMLAQNRHTRQTRTTPMHSWLEVKTKPQGRQRCLNNWSKVSINAINMATYTPTCMMILEIWEVTINHIPYKHTDQGMASQQSTGKIRNSTHQIIIPA